MDTQQLLAVVFAAVSLTDLALVPFLSNRLKGSQKMVVILGLVSGSFVMAGLAAAFWFRWIVV